MFAVSSRRVLPGFTLSLGTSLLFVCLILLLPLSALVMQLARALIRHEAETSPRILLEALKEGLALLPAAEQGVTLMLHPDDIARIEQAFGAEECAKRHWRLQSDPTLSPGDLQLATELSSIDLTLSGRIDQLLRNFLRDNASQKPASQDSRP